MKFFHLFAKSQKALQLHRGTVLNYRRVHSDGPPVSKLDRLYYPLFDFDIDKYGVQMINHTLVDYLKAIFFNIKVE